MNRLFCLVLIGMSVLVGCSLILEEDISNDRLVIVTPADLDTLKPGPVIFWWDDLPDATQYELQLVSTSFDQIEAVLVDSLATANRVIVDLDSGTYQWRIRAINGSYQTRYEIRSLWILPEPAN